MFTGITIVKSIVTGRTIFTELQKEVQASQGMNLYIWIPIIIIVILSILGVLLHEKIIQVPKWVYSSRDTLKKIFSRRGEVIVKNDDDFYKTIESMGYLYDEKQDIFYSSMEPWQKNMGYCSFYDEVAILSGMIIDCEPIKFNYGGKEWLIEFWKGQYGMTSGCEIGVYTMENTERNADENLTCFFYNSVSDEDRLQMSFSLKKKDKILFRRNQKHWWLTGFMLGEFSETSDLIMNLSITLKDFIMRDAFIKALKGVGYSNKEIFINGNTVSLKFDKPKTSQPSTRIAELDRITQRKNEILCDKYQEITKGYDNFPDKMKAIQNQAPEIYNKIINIGKSKELFNLYEKLKNDFKE
jgi:hypothetical protein